MSNIATTISQSRKLVELGLDRKSADMVWMDTNSVKPCLKLMDDGIFNHRYYLVRFPKTSLPAWSLSALLEVIKGIFAYTTIAISGASKGFNFIRCKDLNYIWAHDVNADSPIDAAYEMVCWLLRNNLIKKGDNDERN